MDAGEGYIIYRRLDDGRTARVGREPPLERRVLLGWLPRMRILPPFVDLDGIWRNDTGVKADIWHLVKLLIRAVNMDHPLAGETVGSY